MVTVIKLLTGSPFYQNEESVIFKNVYLHQVFTFLQPVLVLRGINVGMCRVNVILSHLVIWSWIQKWVPQV